MKIFFLRAWAVWRRFRRGSRQNEPRQQYSARAERLMRRANPFAPWSERANWMVDVAEWIRREPRISLLEDGAARRIRHRRARFLLDWLDSHRDVRRVVQATLQKTLREAVGPELFCATGLSRGPAFFSELSDRVMKTILPPQQMDLSALFTTMFPEPQDADWLLGMDQTILSRWWKLVADPNIAHSYRQQIDEALIYLTTMVLSSGISPEFRQRLQPKLPLPATPFMSLRRELEAYLQAPAHDEAALRSVRMLIAVCQAQTDRIYAHLDEYGVSVGLVYQVERMRSQLARMARLIDLREAVPDSAQGCAQVQALLVDLIHAHHQRSSVRGLFRRSFSMLARKMVERNADHGETAIARDRAGYRRLFKAACGGGVVMSLAVLGKMLVSGAQLARFFEGLFASLNYAAAFLAISAFGGLFGGRQPAVTAPALGSKMLALDTVDGLRALLAEIAWILRSQSAAVLGNLMTVIPAMLAVSLALPLLWGAPLMDAAQAHATVGSLSIVGPTPLFAAATGIMLWLASLAAGLTDNWFALRGMREALSHYRRLVYALGVVRAARLAKWLERHVAHIAGNLTLALLLGMSPAVAQFFGLPLDIRHVTLSAGTLAAAAGSLGWSVLTDPSFWLAAAGILAIALLNVGAAFACALILALRARDVPARARRLVLRALIRRIAASPRSYLFPEKTEAAAVAAPVVQQEPRQAREKRWRR